MFKKDDHLLGDLSGRIGLAWRVDRAGSVTRVSQRLPEFGLPALTSSSLLCEQRAVRLAAAKCRNVPQPPTAPPCRERPPSWLVFVVPCRNIILARNRIDGSARRTRRPGSGAGCSRPTNFGSNTTWLASGSSTGSVIETHQAFVNCMNCSSYTSIVSAGNESTFTHSTRCRDRPAT